MGISGSYGSDLPELEILPIGAQIIGTKDDILFRADPSLLGGSGSSIREDVTITAATLANNISITGVVNIASRYQLLQITTNYPCRLRLYTATAKRDADVGRAVGTDPTGNHGLMFEFISATGLLSADLSPLVDAFSDTSAVAYSITNLSGATQTISVTLNHVKTGA